MQNAPEGFESVTVSREDRRLIRLAMKRHADELRKEQKRCTERAVTNPVIAATVEKIAGISDNQPGLIKRFMLDGDSDPEEPTKEKAKKDPRQQDLPLGEGRASNRRGTKGPPRIGPRGSMRVDRPEA
jgi:hypothetical protein